jgi:nicotinamide mononucleotide adenylyltransferase
MADIGMVHGRFQPFHRGHLEYALAAWARCRALVVGITNPDPTHVRAAAEDTDRARSEANPFPYWLRERMVRCALVEAGVPDADLAVVPFPIHEPALWEHYAPPGAVHFLRVFSSWEERKAADLRAAGYDVVVLDPQEPKRHTGTEVRRRMRSGEPWAHLVPPASASVLGRYERMRSS